MKPKIGTLLISEPFLNDGQFDRSIILLCEHNEDGSFGLILNKPTEHQLQDVFERPVGHISLPLFLGGPVEQNTLHYISTFGNKLNGSQDLGSGFYRGGRFEELLDLINAHLIDPAEIRFCLGYSGWSSGQLQQECDADTWILYPELPEDLLQIEPERLWRVLLTRLGGKYKGMAHYPIDPRLN